MQPGQRATQRIAVPKPRLWSDRTPELYRLRSTLTLDGGAARRNHHDVRHPPARFDPDRGLFVNGQPTKLKGVCVHQDAGSFGNAVPPAVWAWRLARLKEMGCNAVRTSHHPFAPEFYDLCDQIGLYVFDEAFDEWTRDWTYNSTEDTRGKSHYGYHLYFNQWHDTDLRAMLRRDRNHPCVVLYSIGNEIPNQLEDGGDKVARELVAVCHEEDPTRPATSACDQSHVSSRNGFMDALDIAGYNYIDRLYGERTYAPERERFPHRLCLGTETSNKSANWLGVRDNDYVIGEFIWTGIDYLGEIAQLPAPRRRVPASSTSPGAESPVLPSRRLLARQAARSAEPAKGTSHRKVRFQEKGCTVGSAFTRFMTAQTKASSEASEKAGWVKRTSDTCFHSRTTRRQSGQEARCFSTSGLSFSSKGPS